MMNQLLIHNARIVYDTHVQPGGLLLRDGAVRQIFFPSELPGGLSEEEKLDAGGMFLAPGMVDIHIHGAVGVDVQNTDLKGLARLSEYLLGEGVTGYLATFVPTDDAGYRRAVAEVERYIEGQEGKGGKGARLLGIHFEGPFVSHEKCGALQRRHFRTYDGDPRSLEVFTRRLNGKLSYARTMTLAPEIDGGIALVEELTRHEVRAFIGHTAAATEMLDEAVKAGARHITHFPNALEPLHHRKPGIVAWGLLNQGVTIDCIADFQHVHPLMLRLMHQNKTAGRMALISDAIMATGLGDGEYTIWGDRIEVKNGITALMDGPAKGTIAGSVISMRDALKNVAGLGVPLHDAVAMASAVPARAAGLPFISGRVEHSADLIAFDDEFRVRLAVRDGAVALDRRG